MKNYNETTQTLIGTQRRELADLSTGEVFLVDQITKVVYGSKSFWKVYLCDFLSVLGIFDSKQVDIFIYIVSNTNQTTNQFVGTYQKISDDLHVSRPTIAKIMRKLQTHNFIKKIQNGLWFVNPNILMRGNDFKRQILLTYYESDKPVDMISYNRNLKIEATTDEDHSN